MSQFMGAESTVRTVQVFSTGTAKQHKEHRFGSRKPRLWWALTSRSWVDLPINVFVIQHEDGLVLFDTGLDPAVITNPNYVDSAIGRFFMGRVFRFDIGADDKLSSHLGKLDLRAQDVCKVVLSHLHFDHIGGLGEVPQAELLVAAEEWEQLAQPHPERDYFFREHIELPGANWCRINFVPTEDSLLAPFGQCFDVMGDGTLVLLPTPGHTAGSISMLVRAAGRPPLLLVGDLTYSVELLTQDQLPGVYWDKIHLQASFAKVRALKEQLPDLVILASHDPLAAERLVAAFGV